MISVAIIITCHNRRDVTISCLSAVDAAVRGSAKYTIYITDDGSTDGTAECINEKFPAAYIVNGDGNLYWNRGMRKAWLEASKGSFDFYLWLNDDLILLPGSIEALLDDYRRQKTKTIVVGKTLDPISKEVTYGGYVRKRGVSRISFRRLKSDEVHCDTMNGNCVLLPSSVVDDIGLHDPIYTHAFGDNDYGLRAKLAGYDIVEGSVPVGEQNFNEAYYLSTRKLTIRNWKFILFHPKGLPVLEWKEFCKKHAGAFWRVNFCFRYVKMVIANLEL